MRRCRRFAFDGLDGLEPRIALSGAHRPMVHVATPAHAQPVASIPQARGALAVVTTSFDNFRARYFQALNLYLTPPNNTTQGQTAFTAVTTQLVNVLAQDVITGLLPVNGSTSRQPHGAPPIQSIVNNRILANTQTSLNGALKGMGAIPPTSATTATDGLYVLTAEYAIEAAEGAVENGVRILRLGAFNGNSHH